MNTKMGAGYIVPAVATLFSVWLLSAWTLRGGIKRFEARRGVSSAASKPRHAMTSFRMSLVTVIVGVAELAWAAARREDSPDGAWLVCGVATGLIISGLNGMWVHRR